MRPLKPLLEGNSDRRTPVRFGGRFASTVLLASLLLAGQFGCPPPGKPATGPPDQRVESLISQLRGPEHKRRQAANELGPTGDPRAVEPLITVLSTDLSIDVRMAAACSLGQLHDKRAVPALIAATRHQNYDLRRRAAWALGVIGDPAARDALTQLLMDPEESVRHETTRALGKLGQPVVERLIASLKHTDWMIRMRSAEALGGLADPQAVPALTDALGDQRGQVRTAIAVALAKIRAQYPAAAPVRNMARRLLEGFTDKRWQRRHGCVLALAQMRIPGAVRALVGRLEDERLEVRHAAGQALIRMGRNVLDPLAGDLQSDDPAVRRTAAMALGYMQDKRASAALVSVLGDSDWQVRAAATTALGRIADVRTTQHIIGKFADQTAEVRQAARAALRGMARESFPLIVGALQDSRQPVRLGAVRVLGDLSDRRGIKPVIPMLKDPDEHIREAAATALGDIGINDTAARNALLEALNPLDPDTAAVRKAAASALDRLKTIDTESRR